MLTYSYLPTKLQVMLLLFNKSDRLECAKVVVLKFGAILFYSGIHCKPLKLWKKNIAKIWIGTFHKSWHLPEGTPSITWCLLTSWIREPNYFMYIGVKYVLLCFSRVVIHILQGSFYISDNIYTDSRILWASYVYTGFFLL